MKNLEKSEKAPTVETVFEEIKKFEAVQVKYKSYGAYDTEPDGIFQRIVDKGIKGQETSIPRSGHDWELYANSMDCTEAANAMHDQALRVVRAIEMCPIRDLDRLQVKLKDYCWRLY